MLENLLALVQEHAQETVIQNPAIPNEKNDQAVSEITHVIASSLQNELASGNVHNVLALLGGKSSLQGNPILAGIMSSVAERLTSQLGIQTAAASAVSASLIPTVLKQLVSRTNDPQNSTFTLDGIFHTLTGGKSQGLNLGELIRSGANANASVGMLSQLEKLRIGAQSNELNLGSLGSLASSIFSSVFGRGGEK